MRELTSRAADGRSSHMHYKIAQRAFVKAFVKN
jgi:hypothetical protein